MSAPDIIGVVPPTDSTTRVPRFTGVERIAHWVNAAFFAITIFTGLMFRFGFGQSLITDRLLARNIHVIAGFGILVSFAVAIIGHWGRTFRRDVSRFNRWSRDDARWLRSRGKDPRVRLGKFNPGQKLNAIFVAAAAIILAATGSMMKWNGPFSDDLRTGATFVHDWFSYAIFLVVFGHIVMAVNDRESLRAITGGTVSTEWARSHRPAWYDEECGRDGSGTGPDNNKGSVTADV